jgi:hypothetical protein
MKQPVLRALFEPTIQRTTKWYVDNGFDVSDPTIQQNILAASWDKAKRSILMEDNALTTAFRQGLKKLEGKTGKSFGGTVLSAIAQSELPIVKVPSNFVKRVASYSPLGIGRAAWELWLTEKLGEDGGLSPRQHDIIMRNLKMGAVGSVIYGLGFYNGLKSDDDSTETPSLRNEGFAERYLLHHPAMESYRVGHLMGQNYRHYMNKLREDPMWESIVSAGGELLNEVPFAQAYPNIARMIKQPGRAAGEFTRGMVVPPDVARLARWTDTDETGAPVIRTPQDFLDAIRVGIPISREDVPENTKFEKKLYLGDFTKKIEQGTTTTNDFQKAERLKITEDGEPSKELTEALTYKPIQRSFKNMKATAMVQVWGHLKAYEKPQLAQLFYDKITKATSEQLGLSDTEVDKLESEAFDIADATELGITINEYRKLSDDEKDALAEKRPEKPDIMEKFEEAKQKAYPMRRAQ